MVRFYNSSTLAHILINHEVKWLSRLFYSTIMLSLFETVKKISVLLSHSNISTFILDHQVHRTSSLKVVFVRLNQFHLSRMYMLLS